MKASGSIRRPARGTGIAVSWIIYLVGLTLIALILRYGFGVDPLAWPIIVAALGGYVVGRIEEAVNRCAR